MGRWTPLILMAGGLAILLGTLLGISFPMGGQNSAQNQEPRNRASKVLPANINVDNSNTGNTPVTQKKDSVAQVNQDSNTSNDQTQEDINTTTDNNQSTTDTPQNNEPIRALW
ncbi:MAG: hypothetical protein SAK29_17290 [Scytonema sp. PMC 1069.18]|nr:hypothetical protein [Scytonema sp. PMC 1069.18]MEC4881410.1 hypothetical protein [Scytonema sp. PMC 1070.18]